MSGARISHGSASFPPCLLFAGFGLKDDWVMVETEVLQEVEQTCHMTASSICTGLTGASTCSYLKEQKTFT